MDVGSSMLSLPLSATLPSWMVDHSVAFETAEAVLVHSKASSSLPTSAAN
jgi:hypothetical protein